MLTNYLSNDKLKLRRLIIGNISNNKNGKLIFSIIIPTYNAELSIVKCLESIQSQTYTSYEVIIIDGNSSDNTIDICEEFATNFPAIQIISEKDNGIYDAMNKGIRISKGKYLFFLGSDDEFYQNSILEKISLETENNDYGIIYGNVFNQDTKQIVGGRVELLDLCFHKICHQAIFYHHSLFVTYGVYDIKMLVNADMLFNQIVFSSNRVSKRYVDLTIAIYSGTGFSSINFDKCYWDKSIALYKKIFLGKITRSSIYSGLLPITKYSFTLKGLILSIEAIIYTGNFNLMKHWISHPFQYFKLFVKLKILKLK